MKHDLLMRNGLVVTPHGLVEGGVAVDDGIITRVGPALGSGRREVDLEGRVLFPGMVDPHTHFGSGDERTWEDMADCFAQDTKDCLIGGVTTILTTTVLRRDPLPDNLRRTLECGQGRSWIDYKVTSVILTEEHVDEIPAVAALGSTSFKMYTGYAGSLAEKMGMRPDGVPPALFYRVCEQLARLGPPCVPMIHAEEPSVRFMLADRMRQAGRESLVDWAEHSRPWAEGVQVFLYGSICRELKVPLYVVHVSRAGTVDLILWMRSQGYPIVAETLACYLATTAPELDSWGRGIQGKIQPPIPFQADQDRLWRAVAEGDITVLGTDTIPYTSAYKSTQAFWDARPGLNIQTIDTLPLMLTEGLDRGRVTWETLARITAENPARVFGLYPRKGVIAAGAEADLVVIDPDRPVTLGLHRMRGGSDYSLWEGKACRGLPVMTFLRGEQVMADGEVVAEKPTGRHQPGTRPRG